VRQGADQLSTKHDTASDEGPAAYTVGHTSHHLQQQPAQAYNGYAEEGPPHGLGSHKPGASPAHAHTSLTGRAKAHAVAWDGLKGQSALEGMQELLHCQQPR